MYGLISHLSLVSSKLSEICESGGPPAIDAYAYSEGSERKQTQSDRDAEGVRDGAQQSFNCLCLLGYSDLLYNIL